MGGARSNRAGSDVLHFCCVAEMYVLLAVEGSHVSVAILN